MGDTPWIAQVLSGLGMIAWQQGDIADAETYCTESLTLARRAGSAYAMAQALQGLGGMALARGDTTQAREYLEGILALYPGNEMPRFRALAQVTLGDVARAEGDHSQARAWYMESLACSTRIGNDLGVAQVLEGLAHLALSEGAAASAVRRLRVAAALREAAGTPLAPVERRAVEAMSTRARAELGDVTFVAEWAASGHMSPEEVLAEQERVVELMSSPGASTLTVLDADRLQVVLVETGNA
jgi:tetratricopeptide (TPR) repeat protein